MMLDEAAHAMTDTEWGLISKLNRICVIMARSPDNRNEIEKRVATELDLTIPAAKLWLKKAEEYLASGAIESADAARRMLYIRLEEIHAIAMEHAVKDQVEVTSRPTRVIDVDGKTKIMTVQHTKVRHRTLDAAALKIAMNAAQTAAQIMGVKFGEGRGSTMIGTMNVQVNHADAASRTMEMSNDALAGLLGAEIIDERPRIRTEILPESEEIQADNPGGRFEPAGDGVESDDGRGEILPREPPSGGGESGEQ